MTICTVASDRNPYFGDPFAALTGQADSPPTGRMPRQQEYRHANRARVNAAETDPWRGLNVEPSQGCWYRLGTICSDAVGGRTHNDAMASTGRFSSEPLASADRPQQSGRIVVGVDASQGSLNALLWALGEARARKIPVHAVLAWQYRPNWVDPGLGSMFPLGYVPDDGGPPHEFADAVASVEKLLDAAVSKATESDPESATDPVRITQETVEGHAAQVLLESVNWMRHTGGRLSRTRRIRRGNTRLRQPPCRVPLAVPRGGRPRPAAGGEGLNNLVQIMSVSCPGRLA